MLWRGCCPPQSPAPGFGEKYWSLFRLPFPLLRVGRGRFFDCNIWPDFRVFRVQRQPCLKPRLGVRLNRVDRAFRHADPAIDAFVRVDDEHVLALVEAVHGAHVDAVHDFAANTALVDDEGQLSVLSADRSGELIHGVGLSSRCAFIGRKWTHRRPTSSGLIGTPRNRHSAAEGLVLGRLPHISLPKCVQSWQTPICRRAPLVARVDSTWCRARRITVRSFVSSDSTARTRASNGSLASAFLPLLVSRRLTLRPSVLICCRTKYPPASSALMLCAAVPPLVALHSAYADGISD